MTSEQIGRVVGGRYRLVSRLAVGGMGVTYRSLDLRRSCPVVLKMPRRPVHDPDGEEYARLAARFVREIEAMRALSHDYIVSIVDHGIDEGTPFVTMRFLPGGSLAEDRKAAAGGEWQPVAGGLLHFWLPSIAAALDFMHSKGIVHRDVKPANIFFDGFRNPFLGDFGIAKVVGEDGGLEKGQTLTATHLAIGTPEYMAPELLSPKSEPDGRADQYALAISVYELLSGRRPFTGSKAHIVVEHATLPAPPLDPRLLGIPRSLSEAVDRALSKRPEERFRSCREFAEAALGGVTPEPNDPSVVRLVCPGCRKVLRVPAAAGGRRGNCPSCLEGVEIAEDFSALWLRSEAALLVESLPEANPSPVLEPIGGYGGGGGLGHEVSELRPESVGEAPSRVPVGRGWSGASAAIVVMVAALLGGLATHCDGPDHSGRMKSDRGKSRETDVQAITTVQSVKAVAEPARREGDKELVVIDRETEHTGSAGLEAKQQADLREAADLKPITVLTNSIEIKMVLIPAGIFTMGDSEAGPIHEVTLTKPYFLGMTEVTTAQWRTLMGGDHGDTAELNLPIGNVDWNQAVEYCRRLSAEVKEKAAGRVYRLPTEAEWEYACRAGTTTQWSFGVDKTQFREHGWFSSNSKGKSHGVEHKKPNPWGLYDMHGNVREWVSDWFGDYPAGAVKDPMGPDRGSYRVNRGGTWHNVPKDCRSASRKWDDPGLRYSALGFRLAMSPPIESALEADRK